MSDLAAPFTSMAERISRNQDEGFGGAFVIVPPGEEAEPLVMLMLDNSNDPSLFWATLKTTCEMALHRLDEQNRGGNPFGRMG